ncbi:MAG: ATP-binding protein [Dehalococcoidales bacterium]|nr:ATP-binding protein [Dehalococcoidales bacterium]
MLYVAFSTVVVSADNPIKLKVGIYANKPKIFVDENGNPSGFWPSIIDEIAAKERWVVEYVPGSWSEGLTRLQNNEIDIMPDVAISEDRRALYDFSNEPVYVSWSTVYAAEGLEIQSIVDLEGKNVAVLRGSVNVEGPEGIKKLTSSFHVNCVFKEVNDYLTVFELLDGGEVDAGVTSKDFGHLHEEKFNVFRTPIIFAPSSLHFAFSKNSSLTPYLIETVDQRVEELKENEKSIYYQSLEQWMGIKLPGKSVVPQWVIPTLIGIALIVSVLIIGNAVQRFQIRSKGKRLEAELTERKKFEELNKLKSDLISIVSHEFRSPLSTIKGYSTMLVDYDDKIEKGERIQSLKSIDKSVDRLVGLVDQLLDVQRMDAGLLKLHKELTDPAMLINQTLIEARLRFPDYRFKMELPTDGLPLVDLDVNRILQVLDNLINNAVKYSAKGTEVSVSARRNNTDLIFSVTDQGPGIPENDLERIFDRMYRIEQKAESAIPGLGLGLSICRGIVEAHGGRIWAESKIGQGSRFVFMLPLVDSNISMQSVTLVTEDK